MSACPTYWDEVWNEQDIEFQKLFLARLGTGLGRVCSCPSLLSDSKARGWQTLNGRQLISTFCSRCSTTSTSKDGEFAFLLSASK